MSQRAPQERTIFPRKRHDDYRVGVVYPAPYAVGMSNLGLQWLLRQCGEAPGFCAERFFLEPRGGGRARSLEEGKNPTEFDILAFSVSYELDYPGVLRFLHQAGIPLAAAERDRRHPLVLAGGAALQVNPEPLAPFMDIMILGEAERTLPEFLAAYRDSRDREELRERLAGRPGMYIPAWTEPVYGPGGGLVRLAWSSDARPPRGAAPEVASPPLPADQLGAIEPPFSNIVTPDAEFADTLLVEIARGCPMGCRYCWAGHRYLPLRAFDAGRILALAESARGVTRKIGLISTAVCQYPDLDGLMDGLRAMGFGIGVSSLRMSDITPGLLERLVEGGEDTITLAPETGSPRLRRAINKCFEEDRLLDCARMAAAAGLGRLKLYLMAGLPGETEDDLAETVRLVGAVADAFRRAPAAHPRRRSVSAAVSPFVPKPRTPLQFAPMDNPAVLKRKLRRLVRDIGQLGVEVSAGSVREAALQWRLAMGSRQTAEPLRRLALGESGIEDFLAEPPAWQPQPDAGGEIPPWSVWSWGLSEDYLRREWRRSLRELASPPCPGAPGCRRCGICGPGGA